METLALIRRSLIGLVATAVGMVMLAVVARASEVSGSGATDRIVVHSADETLRDFCRAEDGILWFTLPTGARYELVTTVDDPAIVNPGDGSFHAYDDSEVHAVLAELSFPLAGVAAEIFILPYPRRAGLESAAGPGLVLLSPGVRPLSREHQHAELTHELGHVLHHARMPDDDLARWSRYRDMRGIADPRFSASGPHADRPHEIFAEDFRALFGSALANYSGSIENPSIVPPANVPGLASFFLELAGAPPSLTAMIAFPNPTRGGQVVNFRAMLEGASAPPLDLFDLAGRRVASLPGAVLDGATTWRWDGRGASGRPMPPGVLLARPRGVPGPALRFTVTP
jgi:hypothetical protein